ncbi:hypothetical protein EG327_000339 [Venturia inaequalis]|uniref:Heterokaryon incompatibility domain-containing protein n=2 Tax=Venturia inaequalis TaxID=5025 RepID=A0A8H3U9D7_VENIN|nr:hypothetical protein EG327_000339 [Venturia inaequalis]
MRLVNVHTLELETFLPGRIPRYAILSHTWGEDEILFEDMFVARGAIAERIGYAKIVDCCAQIRRRRPDLGFVWIDTCSIDKSSSAELSEAINSMFRYYAQAAYCVVFLEDYEDSSRPVRKRMAACKWFTRGWTLQELIAPQEIDFVSSSWKLIGKRSELAAAISEISGIALSIMSDNTSAETRSLPYSRASVAQRMSWVANRATTRDEDMAYCLMGLFDISMPILYGEGLSKAFRRLQEEIIKQSADESLFVHDSIITGSRHRILAESPKCFAGCGNVICFSADWNARVSSYSMSNRGVQLEVPLKKTNAGALAILACRYDRDFRGPLGIELDVLPGADGQYRRRNNPPRVVTDYDTDDPDGFTLTPIHIVQHTGEDQATAEDDLKTKLWLRQCDKKDGLTVIKTWPHWFWTGPPRNTFSIDVDKVFDHHWNDYKNLPQKHQQLLSNEVKQLCVPRLFLIDDYQGAEDRLYTHVVVVASQLVRLTSGSFNRMVFFDAFPLDELQSDLQAVVDVQPLLAQVKRRRDAGEGSGWVDLGSNTLELTSRPSYSGTWSKETKEELDVAVLFKTGRASMHARLSRRKILGEEILILDIGRHPAKGEESLPVGKARVLHNMAIDQPVFISETPKSIPAREGSSSKTKESAAFQFRLNPPPKAISASTSNDDTMVLKPVRRPN